jgi:hypothetical protein
MMLAYDEGANSSNPIRVRIIPPTIRTMLSETPNSFSRKVPNNRKKTIKSRA